MSEDLTKKLPQSDRDTILIAIKNLETYVRGSVDNLVTWISSVDSRLRGLEQTVEERLYDTRPIWHKVVAEIADLQTGQKRLIEGQQEMKVELSKVGRDQIVINDAVDDRLHRLEEVNNHQQNSTT